MEGPRAAHRTETDGIYRLVTDVFGSREMRATQLPEEYPLIFGEADTECRRVITVDGVPVAYLGIHIRPAMFYGCQIVVGSIGGVCTAHKHRHNGYASMLVNDAESVMTEAGVDLVIVSGERGLYRRLDYELGGLVTYWRIPARRHEEACFSIRDATRDDLVRLSHLYQESPVRFRRPMRDFEMGMAATFMDRELDRRQALVAENDGKLHAYLTYTTAEGQEGSEAVVSQGIANEFAGSALAVIEMGQAAANRAGALEFTLAVSLAHRELRAECQRRGYSSDTRHQPGTFKLLNPPSFFMKLRPYMAERDAQGSVDRLSVCTDDSAHVLQLDQETLQLDSMAELVGLVFGFGAEPPTSAKPAGELSDLLSACFPLPMLWPGLNYV